MAPIADPLRQVTRVLANCSNCFEYTVTPCAQSRHYSDWMRNFETHHLENIYACDFL